MKHLFICCFVLACSMIGWAGSVSAEVASTVSGTNNTQFVSADVVGCQCPEFLFVTGSGYQIRAHQASACSVSCSVDQTASCQCRIDSHTVTGAYQNACGCD